MSLDERDYVYDPTRIREKNTNTDWHPPTPPKRSGLKTLIISSLLWGVVFYGLYQAFESYQRQHQGRKLKIGFYERCEALPPNGSVNLIDPSVVRRSDAIYSSFKFDSELQHPVVLVISNTGWNNKFQSVAVHPGQSAQVTLPVGEYGVEILAGDKWCNLNEGFTNGRRVLISSAVAVKAGETGSMRMRPEVAGNFDLMVSYQSLAEQMADKLPKQVFGNGYMELRRDRGGNYHVPGSVNGSPVDFLVDTGASVTSISQQTAWSARIQQCTPRQFNTANGKVTGCVGTAQRLTFGNFHIEDIEVAIMPQMEVSLLGMNVLSRVRMEQQGEVMRVSQ